MKKIPQTSASLDSTIGKARASYVYFLTDPEVGGSIPCGAEFFFIFIFLFLFYFLSFAVVFVS